MAVHYRVHEAAVHSFNAPGQPVYEEVVWKTAWVARDLAILYAPKRTGKLAKSIAASRPKPTGIWTLASSVSASVGYAAYVHDGVSGRIYPKGGRYLTVPSRRGIRSGAEIRAAYASNRRRGDVRPYFLALSVRGQRSQPFLEQALSVSLATNSVLQYRVS
jgi:hypothetical protein